jgi:hypothetical protein
MYWNVASLCCAAVAVVRACFPLYGTLSKTYSVVFKLSRGSVSSLKTDVGF